ncbi:MAG: type II toxin-antitoxin system YafQ family toxin [Nevskiales bacterium]
MRQIEFAPRFKRDFRFASKHPDYNRDDFLQLLEDLQLHDVLPVHYREHDLGKRAINWAGFKEAHLGPDLVVIFKRFPRVVWMHRIGGHRAMFAATKK